MEYLPRIILWVAQKWANRNKSVDISFDCIINRILQDLKVENIAQWKLCESSMYYFHLENKKRGYTLDVSNYQAEAYLADADRSLVKPHESRELFKAGMVMITAINEAENDKYRQKSARKLSKIFPECVK